MSSLEITLLGEPGLRFEGKPLVLRAPRVTWSLIALLIMHPRPIERAGLASLLWPDREESKARTTLRSRLHVLLSALPASSQWITCDTKTLAWNHAAPCRIDVLEFERAIAENRQADAVELYSGDLLGTAFDEAILADRERLRTMYLNALGSLAAKMRGERDFGAAIQYAERLLAADEWREDAVRAVISARYQDGDRSGALLAYDRFARALRQELQVDPMEETTALRDAILSGASIAQDVPMALRERDANAPFVGRSAELHALRSAWSRTTHRHGSIVFLCGEAGIGKSRLAQEACAVVEAQGGRVLLGRTSSPEASAFEAVVEALREGLPHLSRSDLEDVWWATLAPVMPEIASLYPDFAEPAKLDSEPAQLRLREAFARLMVAMAARRPVAIVLEDLHWADQETIELLETLARRAAGSAIFIMITMRSEEVSARHPLEAMRRRLQQERRGQTVALGRLGEEEIHHLAGQLLTTELATPEACRQISSMASGHPLFAVQLLRYYLDAGTIPGQIDSLSTIGEAVVQRVQRLPEDAREIAEVAATIEGVFTVEELARVSGWEEARIFDAVGALLDTKIICERGGERFSYGFTHAMIEAAVRENVSSGGQRVRHRRIAHVLEETRSSEAASAGLIALHWEAAGEAGRAALARLQAAQVAFERFARRDAIAQARQAITLGLDDLQHFNALSLIARALQGLGELSAGLQEVASMEQLAERLGDEQQFEALVQRLRFSQHRGPKLQRQASDRLLALARASGRDDWMAEAGMVRAFSSLMMGLLEDAERAIRSGIEAAKRTSNSDLTFRARELFLKIILRRSNIEEGLAEIGALERELELGETKALRPLTHGYLRLAFATQNIEYYGKARALVARLADVDGDIQTQLVARSDLAYAAHIAWDTEHARSEYRDLARLGQEHGLLQFHIATLGNLAEIDHDIGHIERSLAQAKQARVLLKHLDFTSLLCSIALTNSEAYLAIGNVAKANREAQNGLEFATTGGEPRLIAEALSLLGAAELSGPDVTAGLEHMRRGLAIRRSLNSPRVLAHELSLYLDALLGNREFGEASAIASELLPIYEASPNHQRFPGYVALSLAKEAEHRGNSLEGKRLRALGRRSIDYVLARLANADDRDAFAALPHNRELMG